MKLEHLRNGKGLLWLNVASGPYAESGFVNIDNSVFLEMSKFYPFIKFLLSSDHRKAVEKYIKARTIAHIIKHDCRKKLKFPDESVDHILCSHFLEHVYPNEAKTIIQDFRRVLRKRGTLHIVIPNLDVFIDDYILNRAQPNAADGFINKTLLSKEKTPTLRYRILELLGYQGLIHRWMYNANSMALRLKDSGFQLIKNRSNLPSSHIRANDTTSVHLFAEKIK